MKQGCLFVLSAGTTELRALQMGSFLLTGGLCRKACHAGSWSGQGASELDPLLAFIGAGGARPARYISRLGLFDPDISREGKKNAEPWRKLGPNDQYKVLLSERRLQPTRRSRLLEETSHYEAA